MKIVVPRLPSLQKLHGMIERMNDGFLAGTDPKSVASCSYQLQKKKEAETKRRHNKPSWKTPANIDPVHQLQLKALLGLVRQS